MFSENLVLLWKMLETEQYLVYFPIGRMIIIYFNIKYTLYLPFHFCEQNFDRKILHT